MRELKLNAGYGDQETTFEIRGPRGYGLKCALYCGYDKTDDGVFWGMQIGACIKAQYTESDIAEQNRLLSETPIENGEKVLINGAVYTARILGDYSDAVIFDPINN